MKKKGITFWEQNIEYIVLGVAVLFCLGFGGWQLLRSPNVVNDVKPAEVSDKLAAAEESLNRKLGGEPIDLPDHEAVAPEFSSMLAASVSPLERLAALDHPNDFGGGTIGGDDGGVFPELNIPAPERVQVMTDYDGLVPSVVEGNEALSAIFPSAPYDIDWTTVGAVFNLQAMREQYRQAAAEGMNAIPESWYQGREEIVRVRVERQQLLGAEWGETVEIDVLPGAFSFSPQIADGSQPARDEVMDMLEDPLVRRAVVQPEFLATLNDSWSAPRPPIDDSGMGDDTTLDPDELLILDLRRRRSEALADRSSNLSRLLEAGGRDPKEEDALKEQERQSEREREQEERRREREQRDRQRSGGGGSAAPGGGGLSGQGDGNDRNTGGKRRGAPGGQMFGGGSGDGDESERGIEQLRKRLAGKIRTLDRRITQIEKRLINLGFDVNAIVDEASEVVVDPFESDEVMIWAFDIDVESGATYRYRLIVDCINPFFRKKLYLDESIHDRAESMVVASAASDWSDAVEILPPTSFFVTAAYPEKGVLGMGQIDAEVYRFHDGRWWKETFRPEPGEPIGASKAPRDSDAGVVIDFNTGWYVLDILNRADADTDDSFSVGVGEAIVQRIDDPSQVREENPIQAIGSVSRQELDEFVRDAEAAAQERALGDGG
ncbi:MAG: hypothetical protein AB8G96_06180 [Phycisphaerales bacterium]